MSDETNEQPTAKLEDFGLGASADAETAATGEAAETGATAATAPTAPTAKIETAATAATGYGAQRAVPEAEPAWLSQWGKTPARTNPRVRWAGIIWGLVFVATGWYALWTMTDDGRRAAFSGWMLGLSDGGWAIVGAFALGGFLLVLGLIAALRAASRPRS